MKMSVLEFFYASQPALVIKQDLKGWAINVAKIYCFYRITKEFFKLNVDPPVDFRLF